MDDDSAALRGFNYDTAELLAPTWAARRDLIEATVAPVRGWLTRELSARPGDTVLELAAGVGDTGFEISDTLGGSGKLITSDFSPAMLAEAQKRGRELGVANAEYQVIDAERIELGTDTVDAAICRFGYMLMPAPDVALAETRRVLRPGGRLVLAVWGSPEHNPFFTTVAISLVQHDHIPPPEPPPAPGIFSMASAERTEDLLTGAGFGDVRTEEVPVRFPVPTIDEYLDFVADTAGPLALALRALPAEARGTVRADVEDGFARFATADGYDVPGVALCAVAS